MVTLASFPTPHLNGMFLIPHVTYTLQSFHNVYIVNAHNTTKILRPHFWLIMSIHSIATRLIQEIHASLISSVIDLIEVLLSSKNLALQTLVTLIKSKDITQHILNALAHQCRETVIN